MKNVPERVIISKYRTSLSLIYSTKLVPVTKDRKKITFIA